MITKHKSLLLISVKPEFAEKILSGEKTMELRKAAPKKAGKGSVILIYVTTPIKELWGIGKIEHIIESNPKSLWANHSKKTGITEQEFNMYYGDSTKAFGIELTEVKQIFNQSVSLKMLRQILPKFSPPQTYAYIEQSDINFTLIKTLIHSDSKSTTTKKILE